MHFKRLFLLKISGRHEKLLEELEEEKGDIISQKSPSGLTDILTYALVLYAEYMFWDLKSHCLFLAFLKSFYCGNG